MGLISVRSIFVQCLVLSRCQFLTSVVLCVWTTLYPRLTPDSKSLLPTVRSVSLSTSCCLFCSRCPRCLPCTPVDRCEPDGTVSTCRSTAVRRHSTSTSIFPPMRDPRPDLSAHPLTRRRNLRWNRCK
uniref:Uncharacterized protein n=1 Tax=Cacopsylla melanoneura TaxID=428564 RepID=A0A8D8XCD2_9HEMI